jgi:hypothetical protein
MTSVDLFVGGVRVVCRYPRYPQSRQRGTGSGTGPSRQRATAIRQHPHGRRGVHRVSVEAIRRPYSAPGAQGHRTRASPRQRTGGHAPREEPRARDTIRTSVSVSPAISIGYIEPHTPTEGRFAIVTNVGRGMRWTRVALLTRALACGRRSRVVLTSRRRRQVGGSFPPMTVTKSPITGPITGESAKKTVKTIARGMPDDPA